jgi:hypothetical protein
MTIRSRVAPVVAGVAALLPFAAEHKKMMAAKQP